MSVPLRWAFLVQSVPFTQGHIDGTASLGGSESACLGLARALVARGHDVHVFAARLEADAQIDYWGAKWHPLSAFHGDYLHWTWDVAVVLRMAHLFANPIHARYRILWNQDMLMSGGVAKHLPAATMSHLWPADRVAYVSEYHRVQWEQVLPDLKGLGWVTRNSFDPEDLPPMPEWPMVDPYRVIHISRPERGLGPLLDMWPALKARVPQATLALCRYQSMYDGEGTAVKATCDSYDARVAALNETVGGIQWLGHLGKRELYREIAASAVMWYPGIAEFAETSCIAAIEAQACQTPLVCSYKGALPETAPYAIHIDGDAYTPEYQAQSLDAVVRLLGPAAQRSAERITMVERGISHVLPAYTHAAVAAHWEGMVTDALDYRYTTQQPAVVRALMREDDHCAAAALLDDMLSQEQWAYVPAVRAQRDFCQKVIDGKDQTAEQYGANALPDPIEEGDREDRLAVAATQLADRTHVLDVACGNGAFALKLARLSPTVRITGIDYSAANIERAQAAAERIGVADRVTFQCGPVYDFTTHQPCLPDTLPRDCDGAFVGEFLEHVANSHGMVDAIEAHLTPGAQVVITCPHGPFSDLMPRGLPVHKGHVHHYEIDDLATMFGDKADLSVTSLHIGETRRSAVVGQWLITYRTNGTPTPARDLQARIQRIRPARRLSVGLIVKNAANDLRRCLESVWGIADEIVVGDTGSTDETRTIAEDFGATVLTLPDVASLPGGFAEARNAVLAACTGEWFLWIDADEVLDGASMVPPLLETGPFTAYALRQIHLMADAAPTHDTPIRLFKRHPARKFYGAVHEQPQHGDANTDLTPALQLSHISVHHYGYPSESRRRRKARRNRPLIGRNNDVFPDRLLNHVITMRECVQVAGDLVAQAGVMTPEAQRLYKHTCDLFERYFDDPANKYYALARPFYEAALEYHSESWQAEIAIGARLGDLGTARVRPRRLRVRTYAQLEAAVLAELKDAKDRMAPPPPFVAPVVGAPASDAGLRAEVLA